MLLQDAFGWLSSWDWGSLPDWLAAFGTVGALLATLHVVRSDRRQRDRAQAEKVVVHLDEREGRSGFEIDITIFNGSDQSILAPLAMSTAEFGAQVIEPIRERYRETHPVIRPQQLGFAAIDSEKPIPREFLFVFFTDADGVRWGRRAMGGSLMTEKQGDLVAAGYRTEASIWSRLSWRTRRLTASRWYVWTGRTGLWKAGRQSPEEEEHVGASLPAQEGQRGVNDLG